ncbi:MAG: ribosomal subunit protein [Candidatus Peribacteria bacterium]|nr:ribosomal subunit protein [Candidatus Peribacteria bacterium]
MRFRAVVVVGNRKGKVGLGTGKATEVQAAVKKAIADAKRSMIRIPILNGTIPHQVEHKFKAARLRLIPAKEGTGIIAGGALRVILDHAGVKNVLSKRYGSRNKLVNAQATMQALELFRTTVKVEEEKEVKIEKDIGLKTETDDIRTGGVEITEMKKGDVEKSFTTKGDITGQDK